MSTTPYVPSIPAEQIAEPATDRTVVPGETTLKIDLSQRLAHAARVDARRAANVVLALLALVILSPVLVVIALLIRFTSPGPVIYRQTRVGVDRRSRQVPYVGSRRLVDYGGKLFTIYKFRTMRWNPDDSLQVWARNGDTRITSLGRMLRKYRLDELPQLFNVLRGDMNLVGPRPEQPNIFAELRKEIPEYPQRQGALPGITGWAQVNQGYDSSIEDVRTKVRYDLEYLQRQSVIFDLGILVRTIPVVAFRRGAK